MTDNTDDILLTDRVSVTCVIVGARPLLKDPGVGGGGGGPGCTRRERNSEAARAAVGQEEVAQAVGGSYCRLQMPLKLELGVRRKPN